MLSEDGEPFSWYILDQRPKRSDWFWHRKNLEWMKKQDYIDLPQSNNKKTTVSSEWPKLWDVVFPCSQQQPTVLNNIITFANPCFFALAVLKQTTKRLNLLMFNTEILEDLNPNLILVWYFLHVTWKFKCNYEWIQAARYNFSLPNVTLYGDKCFWFMETPISQAEISSNYGAGAII